MLSHEKKEITDAFRKHETDTGFSEVQIISLTRRIDHLNGHFKTAPHYYNSRVGLMKLVCRRRKLLSYLEKHDKSTLLSLINRLGLRK